MMYRPKVTAIKVIRFADEFGSPTIFEIWYEDGTVEYFEPDFSIYGDGRFLEVKS